MVLTLSAPRVALSQSAGDYVIGAAGRPVHCRLRSTDLGGKYAVELDGSFTFPLIGRVQAGGLTIRNFEVELKKRLADGFFKNPQVTVAIEQYRSQRVFVTGEVRSPGAYPLTGDMTLIEALAKAGSTTPNASEEVVVVRGTKGVDGPDRLDAAGDKEILRFNLKDLQSGPAPCGTSICATATRFTSREPSSSTSSARSRIRRRIRSRPTRPCCRRCHLRAA